MPNITKENYDSWLILKKKIIEFYKLAFQWNQINYISASFEKKKKIIQCFCFVCKLEL